MVLELLKWFYGNELARAVAVLCRLFHYDHCTDIFGRTAVASALMHLHRVFDYSWLPLQGQFHETINAIRIYTRIGRRPILPSATFSTMEFCLISHLFLLLNETLKDPLDVGYNVNKVSAY